MSAAPVLTNTRKFSLQVAAGPLQGEVFYFVKPIVQIGRGPDNDIVLDKDIKVSRYHLELRQSNGQITAHNISEKNSLLVNGQLVKSAVLEQNGTIQIGDTVFSFAADSTDVANPRASISSLVAPAPQAFPAPFLERNPGPAFSPAATSPPPPTYTSPQNYSTGGSKNSFYLILGVLIIAGAWFYSGGGIKKRHINELRTSVEAEQDLSVTENKITELEKKLEQEGQGTIQYEMAQQHYIKGFRDYRQGQYGRALQSFRASLALYPQHVLARKYLTLAQKRLDELVKIEMNLGQRYLGQGNYRLCSASYRKALMMISDERNINYKESYEYMRECDLQQKGRY